MVIVHYLLSELFGIKYAKFLLHCYIKFPLEFTLNNQERAKIYYNYVRKMPMNFKQVTTSKQNIVFHIHYVHTVLPLNYLTTKY